MPKGLSRRQFLKSMAVVGGTNALWTTLKSWGLTEPLAKRPPVFDGDVEGVSVLILGAGIGALAAAYELIKVGYNVTIMEALNRPGGHIWTARKGTELTEIDGPSQVANFDEGYYANLGPWRIPHHHEGILHYCKELAVPLEIFINYQAGNLAYLEGGFGSLTGKALYDYQWRVNMGGYTGELLAKLAQDGRLDGILQQEQVDMLIAYLIEHNLLNYTNLSYEGSSRAGYVTPPGGGMQSEEVAAPIPFNDLLPWATELMFYQGGYLATAAARDQQMTMLQPVGGMDRIPNAFMNAIGEDKFMFQSEVKEIRQDENQARIVYLDIPSGETREITADYVLCNIPLNVLNRIPADFNDALKDKLSWVHYASVGKSALQFKRRFWEEDHKIFGGSTRTNVSKIGEIHYYSYGFLGAKGIVQGYYNFGVDAVEIGGLSPEERIEFALEFGEKVHPEAYRSSYENGFSVAWHRYPYMEGAWPDYNEDARRDAYPIFLEPDGRVYLIGDHVSQLNGWMEGSIQGTWLQLEKLHERVMQSAGS
jgi:monoamine oxidase